MKHRIPTLGILLICSLTLAGQVQDATVARIIDQGKNHSGVMRYMTHLTTKIGARPTGTKKLQDAENWALNEFKKLGLDARLEKWGEVPFGFERGTSVGRMVEPFQVDFVFATNMWTAGTNGPARGPAVLNPKTLAEAKANAAGFKGAWVIMPEPAYMGGIRNREAKEITEVVNAAGIAGRVYGSRSELVHVNGTWRGKTWQTLPKDVNVVVRKSDYDRIMRSLDRGREVVLEFDVQNRFKQGAVPQYNVIADLKGTERPDEMVIVCGHLDSWDPPGSQGATDNGTGSCMTLEAARILSKAGVRPKRTIRFILWSGEEQGDLGSNAYVKAHQSEMEKISALINDDGGTGYHGGYRVTREMEPMMAAAIAPLKDAFPNLPMELKITERFSQPMGSDHEPFIRYGVPAFYTIEGGNIDYNYTWHTQNDRLDQVRPDYMIQSGTAAAVVAWSLANAPGMLPRVWAFQQGPGS